MANLIQATVVNIGGNPQPVPLSQAFLTSGIIMQEATIASSQVAGTQITYYSGPFSNTIFYATETVAALVAAANTGTTSQVQVTVYEINGDSLPVPVSFGFPASGVVLKESVHGSVNTILTCAGVSYGVSETEASIVTAANVGGGGGGAVDSVFARTGAVTAEAGDYSAFYWGLSGTSILGADVIVDADGNNITITNADQLHFQSSAGSFDITSSGIILEDSNATPKGIQYDGDYSANYTSRSLIDKGYADGRFVPKTFAADTTIAMAGHKLILAGDGTLDIWGDSSHGIHISDVSGTQDIGKIVRGDDGTIAIYAGIVGITLEAGATHTVRISSLLSFADNAAAVAGGLAVTSLYRLGDTLGIVH